MTVPVRIGAYVDGKGIGQLTQALGDPALAVLIVLAGEGVFATEEGAAGAATNGVIVGRGFRANELVSGSGHGFPP